MSTTKTDGTGMAFAATGAGLLFDVVARTTMQPEMMHATHPRAIIGIGVFGAILLAWGTLSAIIDGRDRAGT